MADDTSTEKWDAIIKQLEKLHELLNNGAITQVQFEKMKAQLFKERVSNDGEDGGTSIGWQQGLRVGVTVNYRLIEALDKQERVWLARNDQNEERALKPLSLAQMETAKGHAQFLAAAHLAQGLKHPHIVAVLDCDKESLRLDRPFIVMPKLDGETLAHTLLNQRLWSWQQTEALLTPLCAALDYAHSQGLVHRDIKPENIQITGRGPVILDFGLINHTQGSAGTPGYMPPDAFNTQHQAVPGDDIYAVACLIFQLVNGYLPFGNRTQQSPMPKQPKDFSPQAWQILKQAWAWEASKRPGNIQEWFTALKHAIHQDNPFSPPPPPDYPFDFTKYVIPIILTGASSLSYGLFKLWPIWVTQWPSCQPNGLYEDEFARLLAELLFLGLLWVGNYRLDLKQHAVIAALLWSIVSLIAIDIGEIICNWQDGLMSDTIASLPWRPNTTGQTFGALLSIFVGGRIWWRNFRLARLVTHLYFAGGVLGTVVYLFWRING